MFLPIGVNERAVGAAVSVRSVPAGENVRAIDVGVNVQRVPVIVIDSTTTLPSRRNQKSSENIRRRRSG